MRLAILLILSLQTTLLAPAYDTSTDEKSDQVLAKSDVKSAIPPDLRRPDAQPAQETLPPTDWASPENEIKLGKTFAVQIEQSQKLVRDPLVNNYVSDVTQTLARACDAPFSISIKVIEADNINAVALPGGFLYVTSGLVSAAEDEAELAAAIAHQMAHSCAHQLVRGMSNQEFNYAITPPPLIIYDSKSPAIFRNPVAFSPPPFAQNFPPKFEAEADRLALQYMYKAGYDPGALLTFFSRLHAIKKANPDVVSEAFSTHLQTASRMRQTKKSAKSLPGKNEYIVNSSDFDTVKSRLLVLLARRHRIR